MSNQQVLFDELVASRVDELLESESYYEKCSTVLKPAIQCKKEHREQLLAALKMEELNRNLAEAEKLIREDLPTVNPGGSAKVLKELDQSGQHLLSYAQQPHEGTPLLKDLFGLSGESLAHLYELARYYVQHNSYEKARFLLTYLTFLSPDIFAFWLSLGLCLQNLDRPLEAVTAFKMAKLLDPSDPAPYIYMAFSYLHLQEQGLAREEMKAVKPLLKEEVGPWQESLLFVRETLHI